jgi:hypothetical protein
MVKQDSGKILPSGNRTRDAGSVKAEQARSQVKKDKMATNLRRIVGKEQNTFATRERVASEEKNFNVNHGTRSMSYHFA